MKSLLSISDLSATQIKQLVNSAIKLKAEIKNTETQSKLPLSNKSMAMIFDKSSLRTRLSFEVGMTQLGGHAVYLAPDDIKLGVRETVEDSARVISSMADIIIARISSHEDLVQLDKYSSVPLINAMTDLEHPCQVLADLQTIYEKFGTLEGLKLTYLGDADANVINSWALAAEILGLKLSIAAPEDYKMSPDITKLVPSVKHYNDPAKAINHSNVVITDTWVSMGKESESKDRIKKLEPFRVTAKLMSLADPEAIFLHCLPAHRGMEVTTEVIDGPQSAVFDEAENRLHAQKAIVLALMS